MEPLYKDQIDSLTQFNGWPAISLYMPVSRIGDQQDALRCKNLITEIETRLVNGGMSGTEVRSLLESEYRLAKEVEFWTLHNDGTVYVRKKGEMPCKAELCAELRY